VSGSDEGGFGDECETDARERGEVESVRGLGRLIGCRRVDDGESRIVTDESESIARRRECDAVNPSSCRTAVFTANRVERKSFSPYGGSGL